MHRFYYHQNSTIRSIAPKVRVIKNLLVLSISSMFIFGSFTALRTYFCVSDDVLVAGPLSLSVMSAVGTVSGLYGAILARRFTYKITIVFAYLPYIVFLGAIAYSKAFTIYPAVVLLGLIQGPLWNAAIAYLINLAAQFAYFSFKTQEKTVNRFLTVFNSILCCGFMFGHLFSAASFNALEASPNYTAHITVDHRSSHCGRWLCLSPDDQNLPFLFHSAINFDFKHLSNVVPIHALSIYTGLTVVAPFLAFFLLDKLTVQLCSQTNKLSSPKQLFAELLRVFQDRKLHYVLPLFVFIGFSEAFIVCDFVKVHIHTRW